MSVALLGKLLHFEENRIGFEAVKISIFLAIFKSPLTSYLSHTDTRLCRVSFDLLPTIINVLWSVVSLQISALSVASSGKRLHVEENRIGFEAVKISIFLAIFKSPLTSNFALGISVPIPTLFPIGLIANGLPPCD